MKAEDIAAQEVARLYHYSSVDLVKLHRPREVAAFTRVIREAEERGYARAKAEGVDGGPLNDLLQIVGDLIIPLGNIHSTTAQPRRPEAPTPIAGPNVDPDFIGLGDDPSLNGAASFSMDKLISTLYGRLTSETQQGPAVRHDVPLFVYFQGENGSGGASGAKFHGPEAIADQVAQQFVCERPVGIGFRNGSGFNHQIRMVSPDLAPRAVDYIRRAVCDIVTSVIVERDVAWSVALAEAGLDAVPLTPEHVGQAVEEFEQELLDDRDLEWKEAFISCVNGTAPGEPFIVPTNPTGLRRSIDDHARRIRRGMLSHTNAKCDEAAKVARRRERDACFKIAHSRAQELTNFAENAGKLFGRGFGRQAHGAFDVADRILERDDADVPTPDQADSNPVTPGARCGPA